VADDDQRLAVTAEAASHGGLFGLAAAAVAGVVAWLIAKRRRAS
jgi:hypothetical protein